MLKNNFIFRLLSLLWFVFLSVGYFSSNLAHATLVGPVTITVEGIPVEYSVHLPQGFEDETAVTSQPAAELEAGVVPETVASGAEVQSPAEVVQAKRKWPVILSLHASGLKGRQPHETYVHSLLAGQQPETADQYPAVIVAPRILPPTAPSQNWTQPPHIKSALFALRQVLSMYPTQLDLNRIYLTGYSMGGRGCWAVAEQVPTLFAAIVSVAGHKIENSKTYKTLINMPIWLAVGSKDQECFTLHKTTLSRSFIKAREEAKIDPDLNFRYVVYPGCTHDGLNGIPKPIYTDRNMISWLFEQRAQRDWNAKDSSVLQDVILKAAQKLH